MIRVIVIGLGPIGISAAEKVLADKGLQLVGLVDVDPKKIGKTLADVGGKVSGGPAIVSSISEAAMHGAGVAIVTTTSKFDKIIPTLRQLMGHQIHVVSSCEEMSWPTYLNPELAKKIDDEAKRAGVALLGTGVNPGFVMDYFPVVFSSMVTQVSSVKVGRYVDASTRRQPLQAKVGATMTVEHFNGLAREGKIGHMGIAESVAMLAHGLGREIRKGDVKVTLDPVVADREMPSLLGTIKPGQVCGMHNTAKWSGHGLSIDLDLIMAIGTKDPHDLIEIGGPVPLKLRIEGGTPGDSATVASLVNFARVLPRCTPGLKTMLDVPVAGAQRGI
jgi:4-hydroxy-tetrahydrodipicolinate reductase